MSLLMPNRWKRRKSFKGLTGGIATSGTQVAYGDFGLKAMSNGFVTNRELEAARKVIIRYVRKVGKMRLRVFPAQTITKKPLEVKMGKGKGDVDKYAVKVKRGRVLFEISGLDKNTAQEAFKQAGYKLSVRTRVVEKNEIN
ncbi:MAG TPA: 50S ribosomal protein L16 [Candidatus Absconditabacterales bacterium]|nr:50S ribosomal protein L16 [Candidatus Absconditabacterales bacterium]HNG96743.1 50S ribosomal protein L16 [Candidatus Absconditabacterales bacterium]